MISRRVQDDDIENLLPIIKEFCREIGCPFDPESVKTTLRLCLLNDWHLAAVYEGNDPIGLCMAIHVPNIADFGNMQVSEAVWHSLPSLAPFKRAKAMLLMLRGMEKYARAKGVKLVVSTSNGRSGNLDGYLESVGYALKEKVYSKEFAHGN